MTADAKVGLLLGLIFIVIIAFLVNGLPNIFRGAEAEAAIETTLAEAPRPNVVLEGPTYNLPRVAGVPLRQPNVPTEVVVIQVPGVDAETALEEAAAAQEAIAARDAAVVAIEQPQVVRHKVNEGEYLTTIAERVYGPEKGKSRTTLEAIARANGLKSPDMLQIGQMLVLPDLDAAPAAPTAAPPSTTTLVEKFKDVLEVVTNRREEKPKAEPAAKKTDNPVEHTVKRGECLSEISSRYLGTIRRMDEIVNLNRDKISNADDIKEGMILKIPKK